MPAALALIILLVIGLKIQNNWLSKRIQYRQGKSIYKLGDVMKRYFWLVAVVWLIGVEASAYQLTSTREADAPIAGEPVPVPMALTGDLLFSEGPKKGQSVLDSSIGYYQMCFTGNPYAVRSEALNLMNGDMEKNDAFVRVDAKNDTLIIGYVDTKCLDDSSEATPESCRALWSVSRCEIDP